MNKTFERQGRIITLALKKKGANVIISGITKKDGKEIARSSLFPIPKGEKAFSLVSSFEAAEKLFYHLGTSKTPELQNPQKNPAWQKLLDVCAPKEGPDETYIFDEESAGIYTPVLEGIAHKNPKRPTTDGYMKLAEKEHDAYMKAVKDGNEEEALRALIKCYRLYDLASHVAYLHNAKKLKGEYGSNMKVIQNLLKLQDQKVTNLREKIFIELEAYKGDLEANGKNQLVRKIESEFSLTPHEVKPEKEQKKVVRRTLAEQVENKAKFLQENAPRIDDLKEEVEMFEKALSRKGLHELDKERLESLLRSAKKRLHKVEMAINESKVVVEAVKDKATRAVRQEKQQSLIE